MNFLGEFILKSPENGIWSMAIVLVGVGVMIWSNARQAKRMGFLSRRALDLFRALSLATIGLSLLKPSLVQNKRGEESGKILVLMDESWSMGMRDWALFNNGPRSVIGQLFSIARSRGLVDETNIPREILAADESVLRLKALAEEIKRARREVEYSRLLGRSSTESQNRLDEQIALFISEAKQGEFSGAEFSAPVVKAFSDIANVPGDRESWINRLDRNLSALVQAVNVMSQEYAAQWFGKEASAAEIRDRFSELSRMEMAFDTLAGQGGLVGRLDPKLAIAIKSLRGDREEMDLDEYAPKGAPPTPSMGAQTDIAAEVARIQEKGVRESLQAIVLFTDGREISQATPVIRQASVPVFPVFSAGETPRDIAVQSFDVPREMFVGETREARVGIRAFNIDARDIQGAAAISVDGEKIAEAPMRFRFLDGEAAFSLSFSTPGIHRVALAIPTLENEITSENNSIERLVKVFPRKPRVLAIEGDAHEEFAAFAEYSRKIPWIDFRLFSRGDAAHAVAPADIKWSDAVALFGFSPVQLGGELWKELLDEVKIRGAGVILVPGDSSEDRLVENDPLADAIPARPWAQRIWKTFPGQRQAFHAVPADDLPDSLTIRLDPNPDASRAKWNGLPGLSRRLWIGETRPNARALLVDRDSNEPMLMEMAVGAGKSLFLAFDESRRFQMSPGVYENFWTRLILIAMEDPCVVSESGWGFDLDKLIVKPGEEITIRAKADFPTNYRTNTLSLQVFSGDQPVASSFLRSEHPGRFAGSLSLSIPGNYVARLVLPDEGVLSIPFRVKYPDEDELLNATGDRERLVNLAEMTGGKCLGLDEVNELSLILDNIRKSRIIRREIPLWDSPYMFILILCCFVAEWSLRKHHGLA